TQGPSETALADDTSQTAGGRVHGGGGARCEHCQAARRGAHARHTDGGGSADPAGVASSAATDVRADLFGRELWLSAGQECASGAAPSAPVRGTRQALGGGYRSGEVLRSGQSRFVDEQVGGEDRRCTSADAD